MSGSKFHGTLEELKHLVQSAGASGRWIEKNTLPPSHQFRGDVGQRLLWWPSTGSLLFQGTDPDGFQREFDQTLTRKQNAARLDPRVPVVHGDYIKHLEPLTRLLTALGMCPVLLPFEINPEKRDSEQIEALCQRAPVAIALLTADEVGYPPARKRRDRLPRASQVTLLRLGRLLAHRAEVLLVKQKDVELPDDLASLQVVEFEKDVREAASDLAKALNSAGYDVPHNSVDIVART